MEQLERLAVDLQHPDRNMNNMDKIRDVLVKYSCTVTEKLTLKLNKPKNTMTSAVFASLHIYFTYGAGIWPRGGEVGQAPPPRAGK